MIPAGNLRQVRNVMRQIQPRAIVLDIILRGEDAWNWLAELKTDAVTQAIPVLVLTTVEDEAKGYALGADEYCVKPISREALLQSLERLTGAERREDRRRTGHAQISERRVLIIDDHGAGALHSVHAWSRTCRLSYARRGTASKACAWRRNSIRHLFFSTSTCPTYRVLRCWNN